MAERSYAQRPAVAPQLSVRRGREAVTFYESAFGAVEDYRVGGTDSHEEVVSQLSVGATTFWVADESPEHGVVDLRPLITAQLPLERYDEAFDLLESGNACKIVLRPNGVPA